MTRDPLAEPPVPTRCVTCNRPLGVRAFVSNGRLGTYVECEWCYTGTQRPEEPELITDSFRFDEPNTYTHGAGSLDRIIDKLTGTTR